jgi:hypothetical protein
MARELNVFVIVPIFFAVTLWVAMGNITKWEQWGGCLLTVIWVHCVRKDKDFLQNAAQHHTAKLYQIDYLTIAFPFVLLAIWQKHWGIMTGEIITALSVAHIPAIRLSLHMAYPSLFVRGSMAYERIGRQLGIFALLLWLAAVVGVVVRNERMVHVASLFYGYALLPIVYMDDIHRLYMLQYKDVKTFVTIHIRQIVVNTALCLTPFGAVYLVSSCQWVSVGQAVVVYVATVQLLSHMLLLHIITHNNHVLMAIGFIILAALACAATVATWVLAMQLTVVFLLFLLALSPLRILIYGNYHTC